MTRTVVHVSDSDAFGGTERVILQLLGGLDRCRWKCVLMHPPSQKLSTLVEGARSLGVDDFDFDPSSGGTGLVHLPQLVRQLRAIRPTVLHAHLSSPLACKFTLIAASLARVPAVVATAHLFLDVPSGLFVAVQRHVVESTVDCYIAVSAEVALKLRERLNIPGGKIRIVRNAVPMEPFSCRRSTALRAELTGGRDVPVILMAARLAQQKGHRYLLEAVSQVPDAIFILAGDGPERPALERQVRQLGVDERVRFLGYRDDVPELLATADVLVLPSLFEGLPLAVLEAMAASKPVVATSVGGTDEAVVDGETGLLVPPRDATALAVALRTVIQDDVLARRLGANGRVRAATHFKLGAMVQQVADVYDEVLG